MKIEKLPSGSYRVRKMYKGQTYTVLFDSKPTQKEALQAMSEKLENIERKTDPMTFNTAAEKYFKLKKNVLSPSTLRGYKGNLRGLSEEFKCIRISDMTQIDIQKEINNLSRDKSPKTVMNIHGLISSVLGTYRPDFVLKTTLPQKTKSDIYIPTDEDVKRIIKDIEGSMFEVAILLACFGLRRSEILALTVDDLSDNTLTINKAMVQDADKNWIIKTTKTTESTRTVVIPPYLADKIREQGFIYKGAPNSITGHLNDVQDRLGIPRFSIHKLRHYFASKMSALGVPEADILKMGGWSSDHVMKSVYRHSLQTKQAQQEASDKLSKAILS